jgi:hypothetical protein
MTDRYRAVKRVLAVQNQMHRLAQWKLAELERKEDALRDNQERLLRFLDQEGSYTALLSDTLMRRLRNVSEQKAQTAIEKEKQAERTLEESRRKGRMQRMVDHVAGDARREEERSELRDVLEQINNRRNASLR